MAKTNTLFGLNWSQIKWSHSTRWFGCLPFQCSTSNWYFLGFSRSGSWLVIWPGSLGVMSPTATMLEIPALIQGPFLNCRRFCHLHEQGRRDYLLLNFPFLCWASSVAILEANPLNLLSSLDSGPLKLCFLKATDWGESCFLTFLAKVKLMFSRLCLMFV